MSDSVQIFKARVLAGCTLTLRNNVIDEYGNAITTGDIDSATAVIVDQYDATDTTTVELTPGSVILDTPLTNTITYNTEWIVDGATYFATANKTYDVTITYVSADSAALSYVVKWEVVVV